MSTRRTPSTTSLSKYARGLAEEGLSNRSLDFCNAFWGVADGGYDVLLTRVRGAARTTEELRAFWKERAAIEDDYAKRMSKLAKQPLGRDEIGELRNSIDTLRLETDRQAISHANVAQLMRKDLEQPVVELLSKQAQFKKVSQTSIEKSFKAKQTQESYVKKARQKYEDDCLRINSFTAQSSLVQGRDLEKIQSRLERAKQTVRANEREFSQFARALADTTSRWEKEWKVFCDVCQDMEEERIEFIKDNMWGYANAVSTVCVADDESCEKLRVALEQVEPDKDVENFVRDYSTGPQIPDPPAFVDYNTLQAGQQPSQPSWRPANFARSTHRAVGIPLKQPSPSEDETISAGQAGIGANGGGRSENGTSSRPNSAAANRTASVAINGFSSTKASSPVRSGQRGSSPAPSSRPTTSQQGTSQGPFTTASQTGPPSIQQGGPKQGPFPTASHTVSTSSQQGGPKQGPFPIGPQTASSTSQSLSKSSSPSYRAPQAQEPHTEPIDFRADAMLKVGPNAYPVNPENDPQQSRTAPTRSVGGNVGEQDDPLAKQAELLRDASRGGVRRTDDRPSNAAGRQPQGLTISSSAPVASGSGSSGPGGSMSQAGGRNYQASAESVVGGLPPPAARAPSPNPPTASFMIPPGNRSTSPIPVEEVVSTYQQHFPGERKSLAISRQNSVNGARGGESNAVGALASAPNARSVSPARQGHVGIGAHGGSRSPSPQPMLRPVSPASTHSAQPQQQQRLSYHALPVPQGPLPTNSPLGIAIDAAGRVQQDSLADRMYSHQNLQQEPQRPTSHYSGPPAPAPPAPPAPPSQLSYDGVGGMYGQPPPHRQYQASSPQPPPPQPQAPAFYSSYPTQNPPLQLYNPYPPNMSGQSGVQPSANATLGQSQYSTQQPPQQQQPQFGYTDQSQARPSYAAYNVAQPPPNGYQRSVRPSELEPSQAHGQQPPRTYREPSPAPPSVNRSPSPAPLMDPPTGQYTEDGQGVLFYVKALYDYQATIEEEFDFQAGDVIAVTSTPEDGWWSGMLLDEMRRIPGKTIFPSNFVSLF